MPLADTPGELPPRRKKPPRPEEQLETGASFFAGLGMDVSHFAPMWHIYKVGQLLDTDLNRISREFDLSIADFHLLGAMMIRAPEQVRATDLALQLNVSNAALSIRIRRLAGQGLLARHDGKKDRRVVMLELTDAGAAKVVAIGKALERDGRFVHYFHQLAAEEQSMLAQLMGRLHTMMDRDFLPVVRPES